MKAFKSYIDSNGRLAIPAKLRKILHLNKGDEVTLKLSDSNIIVSTYYSNIQRTREILRKYDNLDLQPSLNSPRKQYTENEEK